MGRETVLFVRGLTASARSWDPVVAPFASGHHVISVDLRAHGDSLLATWESDGARIGIALAGSEPSLVRSLALLDTLPEVPRDGALHVRDRIGSRSERVGFRTLTEAVDGWQEHQYERYVRSIVRPNWVGKIVYLTDPQPFWVTTGRASEREAPYCWALAKNIECPTLAMWGKQSKLIEQRFCRADTSMCSADTGRKIRDGPLHPSGGTRGIDRVAEGLLGAVN